MIALHNSEQRSGRYQAALTVSLAFAIAFGLSVGWHSGPAHLLTSGLGGLLFNAVQPLLFTVSAAAIVRRAPAQRLWIAAAALSLPLAATHSAHAYHPLWVFAAELAWFGLLLTCAREKRTLALWCAVICGAFVTVGKVEATRAEAEEQRLQAEQDRAAAARAERSACPMSEAAFAQLSAVCRSR